LGRKPSDWHSYSNRENATYLEQWRGPSFEGTSLSFDFLYVTAVPRIC
jgi:hypothetical protein